MYKYMYEHQIYKMIVRYSVIVFGYFVVPVHLNVCDALISVCKVRSAVWSSWEPIGGCSATCGNGTPAMKRMRDLPYLGRVFEITTEPCNTFNWPSNWSEWEDIGGCSQTCGNGTQVKKRSRWFNPDVGEIFDVTLDPCNTFSCPVYKWDHLKGSNLTKAQLALEMKDELNELKANLRIKRNTTNASYRRRVSAKDNRMTSLTVGCVGSAVLAVTLLTIVGLDIQNKRQRNYGKKQ